MCRTRKYMKTHQDSKPEVELVESNNLVSGNLTEGNLGSGNLVVGNRVQNRNLNLFSFETASIWAGNTLCSR